MNIKKVEHIEQFQRRTKDFALRIIRMNRTLPKTSEAQIIGKQLFRSATSVAANYRAACRARSKAEFFSKMSIVVEEADESLFWIEILEESNMVKIEKIANLKDECLQILKITNVIRHKSKAQQKSQSSSLSPQHQ